MLQKNTLQISVLKKITACIMLCFIMKISFSQVTVIPDLISNAVVKRQQQLLQQNDYTISGRVTDEQGQPINAATVFTLNNSFLSFTDNDGHFTMKLKYPDVKEFTNLSFGYTGKQLEIRTIHIASFPAVINVKMEPVKECNNVITKSCCDINISWTADKLFEEEKSVSTKRGKSKYKRISKE